MTLLSPPLMIFVPLCRLSFPVSSLPPRLTLASRVISWGICHPLSLMISPPFARVTSLWRRFWLLSVGWPGVRPPGWMAFPWSSILSSGPFWVLILSLFSTLLSILAVSPSLSAEVLFPCPSRRVIGYILATGGRSPSSTSTIS